jgi:hypothetical protein
MARKGTFEERARVEVERIKAPRTAEEERKQAKMRELPKKPGSAEKLEPPRREGERPSGTPRCDTLRRRRPRPRRNARSALRSIAG